MADKGKKARRLTYLPDEDGAGGDVAVLKALFNDTRWILLYAQLGYFARQFVKDRFAYSRIPLFQDLAYCIVTEGIRHDLDKVSRDLRDDSLLEL